MEKNHRLQEKIDNYLFDLLAEKDKIAFEQMMDEDDELRQEVELTREISEAFISKGEQSALREIQDISSEKELRNIIENAEKKYQPKSKMRRISIYITTTAAIILALIYIGIQPEYSSKELFEKYYNPSEYFPSETRGGNDELTQKQIQDLYDAICLMEQQPDVAIEHLSYYSSSFETNFLKEDAQWNLAIAYLRNNQRNKTKEILLEIIDKNSAYTNDAVTLLTVMNKKKWF